MSATRRNVLSGLVTGVAAPALALLLVAPAMAQERPAAYPAGVVRMVTSAPPGGQSDLTARFFADRLARRFGQAVIVDPRPGANGVVALEHVKRSAPDGQTILYGVAGAVVSNPALQPNLPFDVLRDFRPVVRFGIPPQCLFVRDGLPVRSASEFIELARRQPGRITYASFGIGSTSHLQAEMLAHLTGTQMLHVPFRGAAPAIQEVAAGRVDAFIIDFGAARPFMEARQVRCLALTGTQRWPEFPNVPTFREEGMPLDLVGWHALFLPAGTPEPIVAYVAEEVLRIVRSEEGRAELLRLGLFPTTDGPAETARIHREDLERWREAVRISGVRPQ